MKIIIVLHGEEIQVDDEDYDKLVGYKWYTHNSGASTWILNKEIPMSNIILDFNSSVEILVDHIDHDPLNNQREILRICTLQQNMLNRVQRYKSISGYKGVVIRGNRFRAQIKHNGIQESLGTYSTAEEAAKAYDRKALELFGEFAHTNFPRSDYE